jgi:amidase
VTEPYDACASAELVRGGDATPLELVEAAIARIEAANPALNAVITPLFEKAVAAARSPDLPDGPFRGVPFLFKDYMCQSAGDPYYAGMGFLKRHQWVERDDSELARRFRAAGFVVLGRTNTPELALFGTTEPLAFGATRNPWNLEYSTGGSSGGSAAAVAAGLVPAAHGNDGAGSVRIPASACGLVGLKVSRGRISVAPGPESLGAFAVEGFLTRSVRDTAAILDAVAGSLPGDPFPAPPPARPYRDEVGADPGRLRIGVTTAMPVEGDVHPDCVGAVEDTARTLESLGHTLEAEGPAAFSDPDFTQLTRVRSGASIAAQLDTWAQRTGDEIAEGDVEPATWLVAQAGRNTPAPDLGVALARLQVIARRICSWWADGFDLLLTPTLSEPPPRLGEFHAPDEPWRGLVRSAPMIAFTQPFNVTGQPAVSLPAAHSDGGLPIGVQLVAAQGREDLLLRVAAQLEEARPWAGRYPLLAWA